MKLKGSEKILIIKPSAIGDILHALPLLDKIKKSYPQTSVSWVVNREYSDLLADNPLIDKLFIFERKKWGKKSNIVSTVVDFYRFLQSVSSYGFDIVIDLQGLLRSGVITFFSKAPVRIGISTAREFSVLSYNNIVDAGEGCIHAIDRYMLVSDFLELDNDSKLNYPIFTGKTAESKVDAFLSKHNVYENDIKIAINPVSRWQSKTWMEDKFAQTADAVIDKFGAKVIFVGGASDESCISKIQSLMRNKNTVSSAGKTSLRESAVLLSKSDLLITNDSGPMHMAVAMGTPVVALFGPTDPRKTGPYGSNNKVIQKKLDCGLCFKKTCSHRKCMDLISVSDVIFNVEQALQSKLKYDLCNDN